MWRATSPKALSDDRELRMNDVRVLANAQRRMIACPRLRASLLLAATMSAWAALASDPGSSSKGPVDFSRDILPIFSDNCFACHGPDEKARKANDRLDTKEGAFRVRDGTAAIVPGKSAKSELYRRLTTRDPDDLMPPPESNHQLNDSQIALIRQWIDES